MKYEDAGGAPINQEEQMEEAQMKVESKLESMGETIRELLEELERLTRWLTGQGVPCERAEAAIKRATCKKSLQVQKGKS